MADAVVANVEPRGLKALGFIGCNDPRGQVRLREATGGLAVSGAGAGLPRAPLADRGCRGLDQTRAAGSRHPGIPHRPARPLETRRDMAASQGTCNGTATDHFGPGQRGRVPVRSEDGDFRRLHRPAGRRAAGEP